MAITALPTPPSRDDPTNFAARGDAFLGALPAFGTEANEQADTVNIQTALATASAAVAGASSRTSLGAANYKGLWSSLTGALSIPASVTHNNVAWLLINNVANVTLSQPGVSADWTPLYVQSNQIGDIKQSVAAQDATWLPCDGSEYTTATYPTLAATLPNTSYDLENSPATMFTTSAGSVAYNGTNTYVMVDATGTISSSTDAVTWVERFVMSTSGSVGTLTYAGGNFCIGSLYGFYYSADGITWAFKYLSATQSILEVRFGNSVYVALGNQSSNNIFWSSTINGTYTNVSGTSGGGVQNRLFFFGTRFYTLGNGDATTNVWYSTNGATWTAASAVAAGVQLFDMDYDGSTNYVVVGAAGNVWQSSNGTSFTFQINLSNDVLKVRFANSLWIAVTSGTFIGTSPNSTTWTQRSTGLTAHWGLAFGNGKWVVAATSSAGSIAHSTDGTTWTIVTAQKFGTPSTTFRFIPLIYAGSKFVYSNGAAGVVHTAADGAGTWTVGRNQKWLGLNGSSVNDNWFADNGSGTLALPVGTGVVTTTNQITYTYRVISSAASVDKIDFFGGAWFASGGSFLARSTDTITWTNVLSLGQVITSVNYNGSLYLATLGFDGASGKVRTSTDGITWTERSVGGIESFFKSFWFGGAWIIYNTGTLYRSTDGITWTVVQTSTSIQSVKIVNNVMFVLSNGTCFRSNDGVTFSRLSFQGTAEVKYDVEYFSNKYIITASPYTVSTDVMRNTIWTSTDGTYFYPTMMPQEYNDDVVLLKIIGSTLYALGRNWIYTSIDGVNWERFAIPRVNLATRSAALINFGGRIVLHTSGAQSASHPVSTTKFRVPEPTLQLGAPSFIKANY